MKEGENGSNHDQKIINLGDYINLNNDVVIDERVDEKEPKEKLIIDNRAELNTIIKKRRRKNIERVSREEKIKKVIQRLDKKSKDLKDIIPEEVFLQRYELKVTVLKIILRLERDYKKNYNKSFLDNNSMNEITVHVERVGGEYNASTSFVPHVPF